MAVYTQVSDEDLARFVAEYDIGDVVSFAGIAEGVENRMKPEYYDKNYKGALPKGV